MNAPPLRLLPVLFFVVTVLAPGLSLRVAAQGTSAITYQGRLTQSGQPGSGVFDFRAQLYNRAAAGEPGDTLVSPTLDLTGVTVTGGLFTLTLDFGAGVFNGQARWLLLAVRPSGAGSLTALTPRQPVTPAPYAAYAANAAAAATATTAANATAAVSVPWAGISGAPPGFADGVDNDTLYNATAGLKQAGVDFSLDTNFTDARYWSRSGNAGTSPGSQFIGTTDAQPLEFKVNSQRVLRIEAGAGEAPNIVAGAPQNLIGPFVSGATVAGGGFLDFLGNILANEVRSHYGTVSGGQANRINTGATHATIGGGFLNDVSSNSYGGTVAGGINNNIMAGVTAGMIPGGADNMVEDNASYALAAGRQARASHPGTFVWADSQDSPFASTAADQFNIRARGGVRLLSDPGLALNAADTPLITRGWNLFGAAAPAAKQGHGRWGVFMEPHALVLGMPALSGKTVRIGKYDDAGNYVSLAHVDQNGNLYTAGSVNPPSDRARKQDFAVVDAEEVLAKVVALPVSTWSYRSSPETRHMGPVAQDFHAAFGLGSDDKHIATVDADGVALAAIKGLHEKLERTRAELKHREEENAALRESVAELRTMVESMNTRLNQKLP